MTEAEDGTMSAKAELAMLVPSLAVTGTGATPIWPAAGVIATVRLLPLPPKTNAVLGTSAGLAELTDTTSEAAGVSASPTVNGIGPVETPAAVLVAAMLAIMGAVLAGRTVTTKEVLLDLPPASMTHTV